MREGGFQLEGKLVEEKKTKKKKQEDEEKNRKEKEQGGKKCLLFEFHSITMHIKVILGFFKSTFFFTEVKGNEEEVISFFSFFTSALQCVTSLQNVDNNFQQERLHRDG